ncbi:MAG TPA: amino acid racemase [archaeon]|nr:amino acid racemase [archaeon]
MNDFIWKSIGVLGGMGPEATAAFYTRIIETCQRDYGAKYDSDFPPLFIYNCPLPNIVESNGEEDLVLEVLRNGVSKLINVGCDIISVPCNTVFKFIDTSDYDTQMLDIVEETAKCIRYRGVRKIGLIATKNTVMGRLYENKLEGIEVLQLSQESQNETNDIIMRILSGRKNINDKKQLQNFIGELAGKGAEGVILGCTELPLLISQNDSEITVFDTIQILAEATVKKRGGKSAI